MKVYDQDSFTEIEIFPIELLKDTKNREPNQILQVRKDINENYIAVVTGKNLIMDEVRYNQLFVFKKSAKGYLVRYLLQKRLKLLDCL